MNKYVKDFCMRGLVFGGFGPIVAGVVLLIVSVFEEVSLSAPYLFVVIISTYLLAFIQAGSSVFNQIEHWPVMKSVGVHFFLLYVSYSLCYIVNSWIPFEPKVLLIFTAVFVVSYSVIYLTVFLIVRKTAGQLNHTLN